MYYIHARPVRLQGNDGYADLFLLIGDVLVNWQHLEKERERDQSRQGLFAMSFN